VISESPQFILQVFLIFLKGWLDYLSNKLVYFGVVFIPKSQKESEATLSSTKIALF
jgi:hypothetical protein